MCRRNEYYLKQGVRIEDPCKTCLVITKLFSGGECADCMEMKGLRECPTCVEIKPNLLSFQERQATCRDCRSPLAHLEPTLRRTHQSLKKYGITYDQYLSMAVEQGGVCAICRRRTKYALAVDHDHQTGRVRGLLCHGCNIGIGNLKESTEVIDRARAYLVAGGTIRECPPDEPLTSELRQADFDRKVLLAEAQRLKDRVQELEQRWLGVQRHAQRLSPDLTRALAVALVREVEAKKPSKQRQLSLDWLLGVISACEDASPTPSSA